MNWNDLLDRLVIIKYADFLDKFHCVDDTDAVKVFTIDECE